MTVSRETRIYFKAVCDDCHAWLGEFDTQGKAHAAEVKHRLRCSNRDTRCSDCQTTLQSCSRRIARGQGACCDECFETSTHNVSFDESARSLAEAMERRRSRT